MNWLTTQTRIDGRFDSSYLSGCAAEPTKKEAQLLNKFITRMKETSFTLRFKKIANCSLDQLCLVIPHDAGWAKRKSGHSQAGAVFALAHKDMLEGKLEDKSSGVKKTLQFM